MQHDDRLNKAAEAGRRATTSPYRRDEKTSASVHLYWLASYILIGFAAARVDGWLSWALWIHLALSVSTVLVFRKFAARIRRRKNLLAREQVYQVRQLDATNPVAFGLGHLFDVDPGLDKVSAEAGTRFAIARVNAVFDEVEAATPKPTLWGHTLNDDDTVTKKGK